MFVSVVITFCDRDIKWLNQCIDSIEQHLHVKHELIFVDNRSDQSTKISSISNYKIATKNRNTYCLEGRRLGLDLAEGDYVWFFDVDDKMNDHIYDWELIDVKKDTDIVQFYYITTPENFIKFNPKTKPMRNVRLLPRNLWSRWFRVKEIKKRLEPVPRDIDIVNCEDNFIIDLMTDKQDDYKHQVIIPKIIYQYNQNTAAQNNYTVENIERVLYGCSNLKYLYSFINKYRYESVNLSNELLKKKYKELTGKEYKDPVEIS